MATDHDHIEALRQRLLAKRHEIQAELREIQEMIRVLDNAPKLLRSEPTADSEQKPISRYNRNLASLVREYIEAQPVAERISIPKMIQVLTDEHRITGKYNSLYAYIHSLLRKAALEGRLKYAKGVGFTKGSGETRKKQEQKASSK
jgi:hypothetical protein